MIMGRAQPFHRNNQHCISMTLEGNAPDVAASGAQIHKTSPIGTLAPTLEAKDAIFGELFDRISLV